MALTCYLDDSGSHEESSWVVVGSFLMNRTNFLAFDERWKEMLKEFSIDYLHMADFVRPHGRFCTWHSEMKIALFREVVRLINQHKIYSLGVAIQNSDFKALFSIEVYRKLLGPYAFGFISTMLFNCGIAQVHQLKRRVAYLGDKGSKNHHDQLDSAHTIISEWERRHGNANIGAIAFDYDDRVCALQAADAIAWTIHRQHETQEFGQDFVPLLSLFEKQCGPTGKPIRPHHTLVVPLIGLLSFSTTINNWLIGTGEMPTLEQMMGVTAKPTTA